MTFGQWLLGVMNQRDMAVKEFTWEFKIPGPTVYAYQADRILPSVDRLRAILKYFVYDDKRVGELMQHFKPKKNGRPRKVRTASTTSPVTVPVAPPATVSTEIHQAAA